MRRNEVIEQISDVVSFCTIQETEETQPIKKKTVTNSAQKQLQHYIPDCMRWTLSDMHSIDQTYHMFIDLSICKQNCFDVPLFSMQFCVQIKTL